MPRGAGAPVRVLYRTVEADPDFGRQLVREYALADDGWALVRVQYQDHRTWTSWRRWYSLADQPRSDRAGAMLARLRERQRVHAEWYPGEPAMTIEEVAA